MLKLPGYEILEKIHEDQYTLIYRGSAEKNSQPVIFKTINSSYPTPEVIARLKREYEITARFQNEGVIGVRDLVSVQNCPVIILEDFGGVTLEVGLKAGPLDVGVFLSLALRLANILGEIHGQNIIHKDINPSNIIWNRHEDIVKIIDFGISLELSREVTGIKNPNMLEGTLAYISPEQTGRMNRFLDYRTDYYSLGVTFFRMLAGRLPFESTDPMELVHAHIARIAPTLIELDPSIPRPVSDIVHKLMAKNVEDRYQSTGGLASDLKTCLSEWSQTGNIEPFGIGREDVSNRFQIPQKLYGREREISTLLNAFERAGQGASELMLVSGLPGSGKSALVNELQKSIVKSRGNFIAGKYDKFKKDVPYSALIEAFSGLMKHLLAENQEKLAHWKREILKALGPNGRVIADVIPELELVIGEQAEIPELGPEESRNRFNLYFQFFMDVFCKAEHPLVLFLDDLQWADHASLDMMKLFLSDPDVKHFFVIGAYRSNEVDIENFTKLILDDIKSAGTGVHTIPVSPLDFEAVMELLQDSLHALEQDTAPLAELLLRKTGGNAFFLGEFLKTLYQDGLLQFDAVSGWLWDVRKVEARQVTDNVVELVAEKIQGLPGDCAELLMLGACFGNYFKLDSMAEISGKAGADIRASLNILLEEGLLIMRENNFNFAHDRIQEAAYGLLPEDRRAQEHHRIGFLELRKTEQDSLPQNLFYIVNHLNAARELIVSDSERRELLELNLQAGIKARASAAYRPALNYLALAQGLLPPNSWNRSYELSLSVFQEAAIAAFLAADYERMEQLSATVIDEARNVLDTVRVYEARIFSAVARNETLEAIQIGLLILRKLGVRLPGNPGKLQVGLGLLSAMWAFRGMSPGRLESLPEITDPHKLAVARILSDIASPAYLVNPLVFPLIVFHVLKLSIKYGNSEFSPYAYAGYAMIQSGVVGDVELGYKFGQLALGVMEKRKFQEMGARTRLAVLAFTRIWKEHVQDTLKPIKQVLRLGMETGDPEFICHSANVYVIHSFYAGRELAELEKEATQFNGMVAKLKQMFTLFASSMDLQLILNLQGLADDPRVLKGKYYDIDVNLPVHLEANDQNSIFGAHFNSFILSYFFGRYGKALEHLALGEPFLDTVTATLFIPVYTFYKSLAQLALFQSSNRGKQRKFLRSVAKNQKKLKRWAVHAPMNFEHKFQLVEAEKARVLGRERQARGHYELAISGAHEHQYINDEALALELYGKFWLEAGNSEIAGLYLDRSRQAYRSWGALAKVQDLEDLYGDLPGWNVGGPLSPTTSHSAKTPREGQLADLATIVKAGHAISSEIVLDNLLGKMMHILMENAGAQKGYLLLYRDKELYVKAEGLADTVDVRLPDDLPVQDCKLFPEAMVRYVERTGEVLVLHNAADDETFGADKYIHKNQTASVLCLPILHRGELHGVLYLENNLSTGAFTEDRVEILGTLSAQASISLENAGLYADLEEKVRNRTSALQSTLGELKDKEQELLQSNEKLRSMDKIKSDFFANISHEFRTPLTLILTPLEALLDAPTEMPEFLRRTLEGTYRNSQILLRYINNLLNLSRLDAQRMPLEYGNLELVAFLRRTLLSFESVAKRRDLSLGFLCEEPEIFCLVDSEKLEQIILNLLSNALKFTESGRVELSLLMPAGESGPPSLEIRVTDTGAGIPSEDLPVIFERFHQVRKPEQVGNQPTGTGIGLALARELAELHGGTLTVTSQLGVGSEFLLTIPFLAAMPTASGQLEQQADAATGAINNSDLYLSEFQEKPVAAHSPAPDTQVSEQRVLVVEDKQELREYLSSLLSAYYKVEAAENGLVALDMLKRRVPDIIVSDLMMPGLDGLGLLREVRSQARLKSTAFVLLTARAEMQSKLEGLSEGADDYIGKPFHEKELLLRLQNLSNKVLLRKNAVYREREQLFADMHDHLGAQLTDLALLADRFLSDGAATKEDFTRLSSAVRNTIFIMHNRLLNTEDQKLLEENYLSGLNLILLRRYSSANRILTFNTSGAADLYFKERSTVVLRDALYTVIKEISTNDLKYGEGKSEWVFSIDAGESGEELLILDVRTRTNFEPGAESVNSSGRGTAHIEQRLEEIGGVIRRRFDEGFIELRVEVRLEA